MPEPALAVAAESHTKSCGSCTAFRPNIKSGNRYGQCRRHAPVPLITGTSKDPITQAVTPTIDGAFPLTRVDLDCEEYIRKGTNGSVPAEHALAGFDLPQVAHVGPAEPANQSSMPQKKE